MKLQSTTSGHYNLPLTNMLLEVERPANVVLLCEALKMFESGKRRKAEKLHRQFCSHIKREIKIFSKRQ